MLRISGPHALALGSLVFEPPLPTARAFVPGRVSVRGRSVPAFALVLIGPRSFTGEDTVELHVPGSPVLVQALLEALLADGAARGARLALPGEFTARAVQNGRLDGCSAEGLLMMLHASDAEAARAAGLEF